MCFISACIDVISLTQYVIWNYKTHNSALLSSPLSQDGAEEENMPTILMRFSRRRTKTLTIRSKQQTRTTANNRMNKNETHMSIGLWMDVYIGKLLYKTSRSLEWYFTQRCCLPLLKRSVHPWHELECSGACRGRLWRHSRLKECGYK